jgi:hypothetical protein
LKFVVPIFYSKLTWISGNGKDISIQVEGIMRKEDLTHIADLLTLKVWMDGENLKSLYDISRW